MIELFDNVTGLAGSRAIVYFAQKMYSPVYGHKEWFATFDGKHVVEEANCAIGCADVPSDRHQGCGFHAHFEVEETQKFVEQIRGTADCITLVESFGKIVTHEKGFRAYKAKIIAVLDWDVRPLFFTIPMGLNSAPDVPRIASRHFDVPIISVDTAQEIINRQRNRLLGNAPNISYRPRL
jgi:hypothetical protein